MADHNTDRVEQQPQVAGLRQIHQSSRGASLPRMEGNNDTSTEHRQLRKSSSMGSLYISTTITKPCVDSIINSVATILHSQMLEVSSVKVRLWSDLTEIRNFQSN